MVALIIPLNHCNFIRAYQELHDTLVHNLCQNRDVSSISYQKGNYFQVIFESGYTIRYENFEFSPVIDYYHESNIVKGCYNSYTGNVDYLTYDEWMNS